MFKKNPFNLSTSFNVFLFFLRVSVPLWFHLLQRMPNDSTNRRRRETAALKYKPAAIKLLLIAEAPPCSEDRYFYFEDVTQHDWLFRYVAKGILGAVSPRDQKARDLEKLRDAGVFLIDASEDPIPDGAKIRLAPEQIAALPARVAKLKPAAVILVKSNLYDLTYEPLKDAVFNVINARLPFPTSGQQRVFETGFAKALVTAKYR